MKRSVTLLVLYVGLAGCHRDSGDGAKPDARQTSAGSQSGTGTKDNGTTASDAKGGSVPTNAVRIATADQPRAGIQWAAVTVRTIPTVITVPGQVTMDERHTEHIGALADGRIQNVYVLPGDLVHRGQTLATLHSHTVHETVAALTQAFAAVGRQQSAVTFATQTRDRYAKLYSIQAASLEEKQKSEQQLAQANKDLIDADANVRAEREHLAELLQVPPESLKPNNLYDRELVPIRAVADGVVISRNVTVGQVLNTGDEAFVTSNLATVWVNASLNEKDVPQVRPGAVATVTQQGAQEQGLQGIVNMLGDVVDPQTRTLPVRIVVSNRATKLRPGMFVSAAIAAPQMRTAVFVPSDAIQDVNGFRVVFVTQDGSTFYARAVETGIQTNGMVEITQGLAATDRVVVRGAFMVKGELLKGTVGEG
ncbi:MAG TPA: efflux RND transporter periplasmic adaptor subunit [Terriglobus sp.]